MLYIMIRNPKHTPAIIGCSATKELLRVEWLVGEKLHYTIDEYNIHDVTMVQADGPELAWVKHHCQNLPQAHHSHEVVTWRGETAQFIVDAIRQAPSVM